MPAIKKRLDNDTALPMLFLKDIQQGFREFYGKKGFDDSEKDIFYRIGTPLENRWKLTYFTKPYFKPYEALEGLIAEPLFVAGVLACPLTSCLLALPGLAELALGIGSLTKAAVYGAKGQTKKSGEYLRDGLTRLVIGVSLIALTPIAVSIELVRFVTRLCSTLVEALKQGRMPPEPTVGQRLGSEAERMGSRMVGGVNEAANKLGRFVSGL